MHMLLLLMLDITLFAAPRIDTPETNVLLLPLVPHMQYPFKPIAETESTIQRLTAKNSHEAEERTRNDVHDQIRYQGAGSSHGSAAMGRS
jgi:hypothetical protein